jgi:predicted NBD/HSP70 family sugar kinase
MEAKRSTVRDLRRHNRSALLSTLFLRGPLSRHELSRLTLLSAATVSNVTAELIADGLVVDAGLVDSDGGRPRVLLRVNPAFGNVIGVDVGETGVKVELFDLGMVRLAAVEHPLDSLRPDPASVVAQISTGLREVVVAAGVSPGSVLGAGIGLPGTVEQGRRVLVYAQTIGWEAVPLAELLRAGGTQMPLFLDNGAKTHGRAEMWFGAGRGARHAVVVLVGSGLGAAVIAEGSTYQGATSSAGEWGHTTIVYGGRRCRCGAVGCLEAYVGAEAILDRYRQARTGRRGRGPEPGAAETGADGDGDQQAALAALIAAAGRSKVATRVLEETAGYLGAGIANLINLFNPERIVLGGWAGLALGTHLLPEIRRQAAAHALRHPYGQTSIDLCQLGADAVAFGAATLPIAELLARGGGPSPAADPAELWKGPSLVGAARAVPDL